MDHYVDGARAASRQPTVLSSRPGACPRLRYAIGVPCVHRHCTAAQHRWAAQRHSCTHVQALSPTGSRTARAAAPYEDSAVADALHMHGTGALRVRDIWSLALGDTRKQLEVCERERAAAAGAREPKANRGRRTPCRETLCVCVCSAHAYSAALRAASARSAVSLSLTQVCSASAGHTCFGRQPACAAWYASGVP